MELRKCRRELSNGENNARNDQNLYRCGKCGAWNHRDGTGLCPKCKKPWAKDPDMYNVFKRPTKII